MNRSHTKKFNILLMIILTLSLTACGEEKKKLNSCESFVKEQFQELYDAEVKVSEGKLAKEELSEEELSDGEIPDDIYFCKVKVAGELYDTVVHIDEHGNKEMFTWYEDIFAQTICMTLENNEYWHHIAGYWGRYWGLEGTSETIILLQSDNAFDAFAEKLTQLDLDSFETAYFVRVEYLNNQIIVPIRKEYTAEDYRAMLNQLLPDVELVEKDSGHNLMFAATWVSQGPAGSNIGRVVSVGYSVYYDGTIEFEEYINFAGGTKIITMEMSDYDYSLLRHALDEFVGYEYDAGEVCDGATWGMSYYDESGNRLHRFSGYIYGSELLEERIERILYKYYVEWKVWSKRQEK